MLSRDKYLDSFSLVKVGGRFHFERERFKYTFLLEGQKIMEYEGDLRQITPVNFSLIYDAFALFIERLDYSVYEDKNARFLRLETGWFITQNIREALEKQGKTFNPGTQLLLVQR